MSLTLKASSEGAGGGSPKRGVLPDALLRGLKLHQPEPPVYIPNLQEETILAVSHDLYNNISQSFVRAVSHYI